MSGMDFEVRYNGHYNNEMDDLGENINSLADSLKDNIGRLKTANIELQRDVEARMNADERRKEFLANVSHELKTPMTSIKILADSLRGSGEQGLLLRRYHG